MTRPQAFPPPPVSGSTGSQLPALVSAGLALVLGAASGLSVGLFDWGTNRDWALGLFLLLGTAFVCRRLAGAVFGPVFFYELVRTARKGWVFLLRSGYALLLLGMLFLLFSGRFTELTTISLDPWIDGTLDLWAGGTVSTSQATRFAEAFFVKFMTLQFLAVVILTPVCVAGAIAEENDRNTMLFLLTSQLHSHEIVLGKLASRLVYLFLFVATGLPVLSLLQFLGGIDPNLVLAGFVATGMTVFSLASLSILCSVYAGRTRTAIFVTYLLGGAYLVASYFLWDGQVPSSGDWLLDGFNAGNIFMAISQLADNAAYQANSTQYAVAYQSAAINWMGFSPLAPPPPPPSLTTLVAGYSLFHGLLALLCLVLAIIPFHYWTRRLAGHGKRRSFALSFWPKRLPRIGPNAMLWKELHAEPFMRLSRTGLVAIGAFMTVVLLLAGFTMLGFFVFGLVMERLGQEMNTAVRIMGPLVGCLSLLGIAVRSAGSISGERERDTLACLLSSPIENRTILVAKWWGSLLCVRRLAWCLAGIWTLGVLTGGLAPEAFLLLLLTWLAHAVFVTSLGLYLSLVCRTTLRATLWTCVLLGVLYIALFVPYWVFPWNFFSGWGEMPKLSGWSWQCAVESVSAPVSFHELAFTRDNNLRFWHGNLGPWYDQPFSYGKRMSESYYLELTVRRKEQEWSLALIRLLFTLGAIVAYFGAAMVLWRLTRARFATCTERMHGHDRRFSEASLNEGMRSGDARRGAPVEH